MTLTDDETDYIDQVVDRSRQLIRSGIWDVVRESRLDHWLGSLRNFGADLLAAYLLDNLCFRSRDQYYALLDALFVGLPIPGTNRSEAKLIDVLKKGKFAYQNSGFRIAPVIGSLAPPTKSGPYVLRLAQRRYRLHSDWLAWPHLLNQCKTLTDLYFLDDFCGTGEQFDEFLISIRIDELRQMWPTLRINYLVTTIHQKGLAHILNKYPDICIKWAELLDSSHEVLSIACLDRYQVDNFQSKICSQYSEVVKGLNLPSKGKFADGFGQLGLAYAFAHATPNNTLPIFWMETPNLTPLLDR